MEKKISASAVEADSEVRQALKDFVSSITTTEQEANDLIGDTIYLAKKYAAKRKDEWSMKSWLCAIACNVQINNIRRGRRWGTPQQERHTPAMA